jgi:hypothetical protein
LLRRRLTTSQNGLKDGWDGICELQTKARLSLLFTFFYSFLCPLFVPSIIHVPHYYKGMERSVKLELHCKSISMPNKIATRLAKICTSPQRSITRWRAGSVYKRWALHVKWLKQIVHVQWFFCCFGGLWIRQNLWWGKVLSYAVGYVKPICHLLLAYCRCCLACSRHVLLAHSWYERDAAAGNAMVTLMV